MVTDTGISMTENPQTNRFAVLEIERVIHALLRAAGANEASATAVTRALVTASRMGTDSHGLRLLPHYVRALEGGRINPEPRIQFTPLMPATGRVDADNGFGHPAAYDAIGHAVEMAKTIGIGGVSIINSSHFGAAGVYAVAAAEAGMIAWTFSHSDAFVLPHNGTQAFHGTNPIAFAAPLGNGKPYLLDMATSAVPWNRVEQYKGIGRSLPADVAGDASGEVTTDPNQVAALLPLGGKAFGFKGMGLASMVEVLSAPLTGMANGARLLPMIGDDMHSYRHLGHFVLAMNPAAFVDSEHFLDGMQQYLDDLRAQPARGSEPVMAPGDREWQCQMERDRLGIPIDTFNQQAYAELTHRFGVAPLAPLG